MTPKLTEWKPLGETLKNPAQQRLLAALRSALPKGELCVLQEHLHGEVKEVLYPPPPVDGAQDTSTGTRSQATVLLSQLGWRFVEFVDCNERDMALWHYQGIAWIDDKRVDFSGRYLRDLTTGGFWEFELKTIGV